MSYSARVRVVCLGLFCVACIGGFYLYSSAWPQPQAYHDFADQRPLLGLPHMLNVVSNLPFLIVGVWGLAWMAKEAAPRESVKRRETCDLFCARQLAE